MAISLGHVMLYKTMPSAGWLEMSGYFAGGIAGITASMWFHQTVKAWWRARRDRRSPIKRGPTNPLPPCKSRPKGFPGDEHASSIYPD